MPYYFDLGMEWRTHPGTDAAERMVGNRTVRAPTRSRRASGPWRAGGLIVALSMVVAPFAPALATE